MTSPVDVTNQAASQMGARAQCTSINPSDGTPLGDAASLLYTTQVQAVLRAAKWNCARWQAPLTLLKAAAGTPPNPNGTTLPIPPLGFLYEYAFPVDCLAPRFILPTPLPQPAVSPPLTTAPQVVLPFAQLSVAMPFVIGLDFNTQVPPSRVKVILTNAFTAQLIYTADISNQPDLWDPQLFQAIVAVLGAYFVNPLNLKSSLLQERAAVAKALIMDARISDGNEEVTPNDHLPDWMQARFRSGGFNFSAYQNGAQLTYGWSVMGLPGGISF
jgi:hypothetical protein